MTFIHLYLPAKETRFGLLLLHGTGGDENDLVGLGRTISPSLPIISVRGKVLEGRMNRFFKRYPDGTFDREDLIFRTNELADFIEVAKKKYKIDDFFALGYSNGANIAASVLLLRPEVIAGGILFRALLPLEHSKVPNLSRKSIFLSLGTNDRLIPKEKSEALISIFKKAGAKLTQNMQEGGHELHKEEIIKASQWIGEVI